MTIAIDGTPSVMGLTAGRVYRVGDAAVTVLGNRVSSVNDDGLVFDTVTFADDSGLGLGNLLPYHVHDNGDATFGVFYQIRDADPLPVTQSSWLVTLDSATGEATGPATQLTAGPVSATDQTMLISAVSLPDGNIAVFNHLGVSIMDKDGALVTAGAPGGVTGRGTYAFQQSWDMAVVGNKFVLGAAEIFNAGTPATLQFYNFDGTLASDVINIGSPDSNILGGTPAIQMAGLSSGKLLVTWVETNRTGIDESQTSTWFKILNSDGTTHLDDTLVNAEVTEDRQDTPIVTATESGFVIGYSVLSFSPPALQEGRLKQYTNDGALIDTLTDAYLWGVNDMVRTDNNTAIIVGGPVTELILPGDDTEISTEILPEAITGTSGDDVLDGTEGADTINALAGNDILRGLGGDDTLNGGDGTDTINGGDGNDTITGGDTNADRRDTIFGGAGDDSIDAGHGNDLVYGQDGNDTIAGGFGADELFGQDGNDVITGSAFSDLVFGGAGDDFVNGGFGFDRINGGTGADRFFHAGADGHASDWLQDYSADEGDVLLFGIASASASDFVVRFAHTASAAGERSGDDDVQEAFVNYRGETLWALVDGGGQTSINLQIGGELFDLLA